jgi:hypothetical protein
VKKSLLAAALLSLTALPLQAQQSFNVLNLVHRSSPIPTVASVSAIGLNLTIPADTEVHVQLLSGVQTQFSKQDDPVVAQLTEPLYVGGQVALPLGTLFDGRVTRVRAARRYGHPAELSFRFQSVTFPNGDVKSISAVLASLDQPEMVGARVNSEGQLRPLKPHLWKRLTGGFVGAGGFALAKVAFAGSMGLAAGAPAGGAAMLAYEFFWRRGREINVPPATPCRIRFTDPLTLESVS